MESGLVNLNPEQKKADSVEFCLPELSNHEQIQDLNKDISCSSSLSSESSDSDDFFQFDPIQISTSMQPNPSEPAHSSKPSIRHDGEISLSSKYLSGNFGEDETQPYHQSPPVHADPNRIPSSIFTQTKSAIPMEWSVASNESLFSIHMGNSSFSGDHMYLMGRSGDLTNFSGGPMDSFPSPPNAPMSNSSSPSAVKVEQWFGQPGVTMQNFPSPPNAPMSNSSSPSALNVEQWLGQPGVTTHSGPSPPSASGSNSSSPSTLKVEQWLEHPEVTEATNAEAMKDVLRAAAEEHAISKEKLTEDGVNHPHSISRHSASSTSSFGSFAFPILTGEGRSGSIKMEPEHQKMRSAQQEQHNSIAETPKVAPPTAKGRFPCLTCCPFCC